MSESKTSTSPPPYPPPESKTASASASPASPAASTTSSTAPSASNAHASADAAGGDSPGRTKQRRSSLGQPDKKVKSMIRNDELRSLQSNQYTFRRGIAFIAFNTETGPGNPRTQAYLNDAARIGSMFTKIGFDVAMHRDLSKQVLEFECREFAELDFQAEGKNYDAMLFVLLSTGSGRGGVKGHDGKHVHVGTLTSPFANHMCPSLAGKPKIFLVHTVRGGADAYEAARDDLEAAEKFSLPADTILSFAAAPTTAAWDASASGSMFVSELLAVLRSRAGEKPLDAMLDLVADAIEARGRAKNRHQGRGGGSGGEDEDEDVEDGKGYGGYGGDGGGDDDEEEGEGGGGSRDRLPPLLPSSLPPVIMNNLDKDLLLTKRTDRCGKSLITVEEAGKHHDMLALFDEMRDNPQSVVVQAEACRVLAAMCKDSDADKDMFLESGGITALLDVLRVHETGTYDYIWDVGGSVGGQVRRDGARGGWACFARGVASRGAFGEPEVEAWRCVISCVCVEEG